MTGTTTYRLDVPVRKTAPELLEGLAEAAEIAQTNVASLQSIIEPETMPPEGEVLQTPEVQAAFEFAVRDFEEWKRSL